MPQKPSLKENKVIFLDRDGVINADPKEKIYVRHWDEFQFNPGVVEALGELVLQGYKIFVVSNQAGVAKGLVDKEELYEITRQMENVFEESHIRLSGVFYCMHQDEDNCICRKPKPGLYDQALQGLKVNPSECYVIGDSERDLLPAQHLGFKKILVLTGKSSRSDAERFTVKPDFIAKDLREASEWILQ